MALVNWDASYSVKVVRCDDDHKKLFVLMNELHDAMLNGKGSEKIRQVVGELATYTKVHFTAEEALLQKTNYPALDAHKVQHKEFVHRVEQFQQSVGTNKAGSSIEVLEFLKEWLTKHIKRVDQQYSAHLNAHGVA